MNRYYAVLKGRNPGIYTNWLECQKQVDGFSGAVFKSFGNKNDAEFFISQSEQHKVSKSETSSFEGFKVWTDGSFRDGKAGYAVVDENGLVHYGSVYPPTNNRGELTGILRALQIYNKRPLIIHSDSQYSIKTLTEWIFLWKKRYGDDPKNWKTSTGKEVLNVDILTKIQPLIKEVSFVHVRAHRGDTFNEIADRWADKGRYVEGEAQIKL